jgi:hypothetical protein
LSIIYLYMLQIYVFSVVIVIGKRFSAITANVLQLQEVGDFEAQNCLPPLYLIRSTKLQLTTEPPISSRCCYAQYLN